MSVTNAQSGTNVHEIGPGVFRISTPVSAVPGGFTFNQILLVDARRLPQPGDGARRGESGVAPLPHPPRLPLISAPASGRCA